MTTEVVVGFKGFQECREEGKLICLKCKDQSYAIGETATYHGDIVMCMRGFHFCRELSDVDTYYWFPKSIVARISVPIGAKLITVRDKCVTNLLRVEELLNGQYDTRLGVFSFENGKLTHHNRVNGEQFWLKNGELHRDGDAPAYIGADGTKEWYKEGKRHRDGDAPAYIGADGTQGWYNEGKLNRDGDLPAVIFPDGRKEWWMCGELHRDGDLPAVIYTNGTQFSNLYLALLVLLFAILYYFL